jgi:hypothetical protein
LRSHASVQSWIEKNKLRETNVAKARRRRGKEQASRSSAHSAHADVIEPRGNGELPPAGKKGAAAALERLEAQEEEAHRRLVAALGRGNPVEIDAAQTFWLKCAETLRRLDLAIEVNRRSEEEQISKRKARDAVLFTAEWFRIALMQFLSSACMALLGIKEIGELKAYIVERFKGILDLTVKNADTTRSAIPDWAKERIREAWNVSD